MNSIELRYNYAFTGAAMKFTDFARLVDYITSNNLSDNISAIDYNDVLRRENQRTNKREYQELIKRFSNLTPLQVLKFNLLDVTSKRQLTLLALCKTYPIIRDFLVEVVRDKFFMLENNLNEGDYNSFLNHKKEIYPHLEEFSISTEKKARQVVWRVLEEGGIINNSKEKRIIPQFLSQRVESLIIEDNPELLKLFLYTDPRIKDLL